jgi:hypothetical protein
MKTVSKLILAGAFAAMAASAVNAQTQTPSTVDPNAQQKTDQPQPPKTTGAMDNAAKGVATSPDDVKRQTEGRPTAADEAKGASSTAPKPDVTKHSPGTVGASPGNDPAQKK